MVLHAPLELQYWWLNVFAGNIKLFFFILLAAVIGLAAKFRMGTAAFGIIFATFILLIGQYYPPLYILSAIIFGLAIVPVLMRIINKN